MPALVHLYLRNIAFGALLAGVFVTLLMVLNVANLWGLITNSDMGLVALFLLWAFHTIVFSAVQFAIAVMRMSEPQGPRGGLRQHIGPAARVAVAARRR